MDRKGKMQMNHVAYEMLTTPIAYIIFNRPRHTRRSFEAIRAQRPGKLFIIADGPRRSHPSDAALCEEVRNIVAQVDWPCEVLHNYADDNLGCKQRVATGLDWVFSQVEEAIILEDDCLPHPDFFTFCKKLLEYYRDDERVWVITGNNFQNGRKRGRAAYYFSKYNHVWGWATWRRAWQKNDLSLSFWPEWKHSAAWAKHAPVKAERRYWSDIFDRMYRNEIDTWDYPWSASVWYHGGLAATPNVNLVTNIGFGPDGTHTVANSDQEGQPVFPLGPLTHPATVEQDRNADRYVFDNILGGINGRWYNRGRRLAQRILKRMQRAFTR